MIDHLSIGTSDLRRAIRFYEPTFTSLGIALQHQTDAEVSFGPGSDRTFWLYPSAAAAPMPGMHIAFAAPSREAVDHAHAVACAHGGTSVRVPGRRPEISEEYYGAIVLDPDGHKLELVAPGGM